MKSPYIYCVITEVPDPFAGDDGNLASLTLGSDRFPESDLYFVKNSYPDEHPDKPKMIPVHWRDLPEPDGYSLQVPVFTQGELLILSRDNEREVSGVQRKPSKWFIEYEYFDDLEPAVQCAMAATQKWIDKDMVDLGDKKND